MDFYNSRDILPAQCLKELSELLSPPRGMPELRHAVDLTLAQLRIWLQLRGIQAAFAEAVLGVQGEAGKMRMNVGFVQMAGNLLDPGSDADRCRACILPV